MTAEEAKFKITSIHVQVLGILSKHPEVVIPVQRLSDAVGCSRQWIHDKVIGDLVRSGWANYTKYRGMQITFDGELAHVELSAMSSPPPARRERYNKQQSGEPTT